MKKLVNDFDELYKIISEDWENRAKQLQDRRWRLIDQRLQQHPELDT